MRCYEARVKLNIKEMLGGQRRARDRNFLSNPFGHVPYGNECFLFDGLSRTRNVDVHTDPHGTDSTGTKGYKRGAAGRITQIDAPNGTVN